MVDPDILVQSCIMDHKFENSTSVFSIIMHAIFVTSWAVIAMELFRCINNNINECLALLMFTGKLSALPTVCSISVLA